MKFSVNEIMSHIFKQQFAKSNLYEVKIVGGGKMQDASEDVMFNCSAINVPGINVAFSQFRPDTIGVPRNLATGKNYTEINMSFYESKLQKERQFFVDWIDTIYNKRTKRVEFLKNYAKTIIITQYTKTRQKSYECQLLECFPSNVSPLDKSYSAGDSVSQFNVNIQFSEIKETYFETTDQGIVSWL